MTPEQCWCKSMRPCFVIIGCALDVAAFRCLSTTDASRCCAENNGMEVWEVWGVVWEC